MISNFLLFSFDFSAIKYVPNPAAGIELSIPRSSATNGSDTVPNANPAQNGVHHFVLVAITQGQIGPVKYAPTK